MKKKILSILAAALILLLSAANAADVKKVQLGADGSEIVTLIVEVEGDALLTGENTLGTYSVQKRQTALVDSHSKVMSEVNNEVDQNADMGFTYTALFNGFSIETESSNIEKIKAIEGVKNVYIAGESYIIEPYLESSSDMVGAPYSYDLGFSGEGMAVAIIDAGCDTSHVFFEEAPVSPKYSKSEMETLIQSVTLNSGVSEINQVYKNEKIPYAYNYLYKSGDTYLSGQNHGTHVSGIVAGKNGVMTDGTVFSGIAPEAQLFIMSCGTAGGAINNAAVVAAINDAALLGADVINMSFGIDYYDSKTTFSYKSLIQNARDAGIMIMAAAGNASRGFYEETPQTSNIDYSAAGVPATHSSATAVASATNASMGEAMSAAENKKIKYNGIKEEVAKAPGGGQISSFSAWGVDSTLQIKPEITAPGGNIYSSINGDKYKIMSGTSMATPHMSGVAALAMQYYKTNPFVAEYNNLTGGDKVDLIENIIMNSADIIRDENGVAQSPRVQGAGLVNVENMLRSRVLVRGDSGKAKLSLGDEVTNVLDISFDIINISKEAVTFDKISAEVMTDGYIKSGNKYLVDKTVGLDIASHTLPQSITLQPGEKQTVVGQITLDDAALAENEKIFKNGFFIDGFISLENEDTHDSASMPFMGFYGDWAKAPLFDASIYEDGGSNLLIPKYEDISGTYLSAVFSNAEIILGKNLWFDGICDEKYIAFPGGAVGLSITTTNHRAIQNWAYSVTNSAGTALCKSSVMTNMINKYQPIAYTFAKAGTRDLPEGDYSVNVTGNVVGDADVIHSMSIPFVIDKTPPTILDAEYDENSKTVTVTANDNHYISMVYAEYLDADGETVTECGQITDTDYQEDEIQTVTLDVSDIAHEESLVIGAFDYATNHTYYQINYFEDEIGAEVASLSYTDALTSVSFNLRNNTDAEITPKVLVAFYNESGALVAMDSSDVKLSADKETTASYSIFEDTADATKIKLYIWDFKLLSPYDTAKTFILE